MEAPHILKEIAGKVAPGRPPAYKPAHALMALETIGSGLGVGRQRLSEALRLGEGTVRTLVGRLKDLGLIETYRSGMSLTGKGEQVLEELNGLLETCDMSETPITVGPVNRAVMVRGGAGRVGWGIEQRDTAIIAGAQGATTLVYKGGRLRMPGMEDPLDPEVVDMVMDRLGPSEGDAIIIGSSGDPFLAELGAKSAALDLLEG
jgi:hypothetical protein